MICRRDDLRRIYTKPVARAGFSWLTRNEPAFEEGLLLTWCWMCFVMGWVQSAREFSNIREEAETAYFSVPRDDRERGHTAQLFYASALAGRWMSIRVGDTTHGGLDADDVRRAVRLLLNPNGSGPAIIPFDFSKCAEKILSAITEASRLSDDQASLAVVEEFKAYAEAKDHLIALDSVWRLLDKHGERELLAEWAEAWIGSNGRAWRSSLEDRAEAVELFVPLCNGSGLSDLAASARQRQRWADVGYIGRKEYSLHEPAEWFELLSRSDADSWRTEGMRLLAISRVASSLGDSRASIDAEHEVFGAVIRKGIETVWAVSRASGTRGPEKWLDVVDGAFVDALTEYLAEVDADELHLKSIWSLMTGALLWQDRRDRAKLFKIKTAIERCAQRGGRSGLSTELNELAPAEYAITITAESDGAESVARRLESLLGADYEAKDSRSLIEILLTVAPPIISQERELLSAVWSAIAFSAPKLGRNSSPEVSASATALLNLLNLRNLSHDKYGWHFDGASVAYRGLIPLLSDEQRWKIAESILQRMHGDAYSYRMLGVADDLDLLCRARSEATGVNEARRGLTRLLNMHELWIESDGRLPPVINHVVLAPSEGEFAPGTWPELAAALLLSRVDSRDTYQIQAALRGLWAIERAVPGTVSRQIAEIRDPSDRRVNYLLLLAERIALAYPDSFRQIRAFTEMCFRAGRLDSALQGWVVLQASERAGGEPCPAWNERYTDVRKPDHSANIVYSGKLVDIPPQLDGALPVSHGPQIASGILSRFAALIGEDVDDLEARLVHAIRQAPPVSRAEPVQSKRRGSGTYVLRETSEHDALFDIINNEFARHRWSEVPTVRFAQALVSADEPFLLLESSPTLDLFRNWPVDAALTALIQQGDRAVQSALMDVATRGLGSDDVLGAAWLTSYTEDADIRFHVRWLWRLNAFDLSREPPSSVPGGRFFALYDMNRYEPQVADGSWLSLFTGGLLTFIESSPEVFPPKLWQKRLGWSPSIRDPRVWWSPDRIVARFERFSGPYRDQVRERYYRHPIMHRWVISKSAFEEARTLLGGTLVQRYDVKIYRINDQ